MSIYIKNNNNNNKNMIKNIYFGTNNNNPKKIIKGYINIDSQIKILYNNENNENENKILPSEYTRLKYITSKNDSYFNIMLNNFNSFGSLNINFSTTNSNNLKIICGYYYTNNRYFDLYSNSSNNTLTIALNGTNKIIKNIEYSNIKNIKINIFKNNKYYIIFDNNDNTSYSRSSSLDKPTKLTIFKGYNDSGVLLGNGGIKIYSLKYYYDNLLSKENLAINLIPCINDLDEVGMYDTVSGNFYKSIGTEEFIAGTEEENEEENNEESEEGGNDNSINDYNILFEE